MYYKNSRALLSESDLKLAFLTFEKTAKELKSWKMPKNAVSVKSVIIRKIEKSQMADKCKYLVLLDNTRFGDRFSGLSNRQDGEEDDLIIKINADDDQRWPVIEKNVADQIKAIRFFDSIFNNLKGGNMFASLAIRDKKDKNIECSFTFEIYLKVHDGQFQQEAEQEGMQSDFNI